MNLIMHHAESTAGAQPTPLAAGSRPKTVLMIAYSFPPIGGSGVHRTAKFVKYLPQLGWRPVVVCGDDARSFGHSLDLTLLDGIPPEALILRTRFVSPYGVRRRLQRLFRVRPTMASARAGEGERGRAGEQESKGADGSATGQDWKPAGKGLRLLGRVLHPLEFPPIDAALYWALSIVPLCRRVIEAEKVDLIYTSSDPYSDHVAGWILKRLTGRPWVADFRDPWTQAWNYSQRGWRRDCDLFAEQRVLRYADRVIGVTPSETRGLRDLVSTRNPAGFVTIENGFDEEDFGPGDPKCTLEPGLEPLGGLSVDAANRLTLAPALTGRRSAGEPPVQESALNVKNTRPPGAKTVLAHIGIVYDGTAMPFLQALERLGPAGEKLQVRFVGGLAPQESRWLAEHAVSAEIEVRKRVSHAEAVGQMCAADAVLLIFGTGPRWAKHYPGKLFEYMRCGSPSLMIGPEGDASRLVQASGTGCFVDVGDTAAVAVALRLLAEQPEVFRAQYYRPQADVIAHYERRALTARLAELFEDAVRSTPGGTHA